MNKTLSDIRGMMRARLNEPSPGFWLNPVLNSHIQSAYNEYYQLFLQKNPEQESRTLDVTLTGGTSSVALTTTGHAIGAIKVVEDRTQPELAAPISRLQSREEFIQRSMAADVTTDNGAFQYLYEVVPTVGTGVFTLTQTLFLAPTPTSSKSLRIHYAAGPQVLAGGQAR